MEISGSSARAGAAPEIHTRARACKRVANRHASDNNRISLVCMDPKNQFHLERPCNVTNIDYYRYNPSLLDTF